MHDLENEVDHEVEVFVVAIQRLSDNQILTFNLSNEGPGRIKELYTQLGDMYLMADSTHVLSTNNELVGTLLTPLEDLKDWLFEVDFLEQDGCDD